ncbi:MAG TPA: hypothetical protein VFY90_06620, partial [Tepidiformaceae bacterium]|nr:hypothetical protein [Tepidiformaceae bacterium]
MRRMLFGIVAAAIVAMSALLSPQSLMANPKVDTERFTIDTNQPAFTALPGARAYFGIENGASWRIEVPDNWNGELVLYAHGYAGNAEALNVGTPSFLRAHLIEEGYAWAASSYQANGYVPGLGAEDTYDLIEIFRREVGKDYAGGVIGDSGTPNRIYLYGLSMGGHVVGHMIEKWPNTFAGALPACGVMGDNELFDFFQDMYLLAETLVGNDPIVPTPADYYTNPAQGWQVTRTLLGSPYPTNLTATGQQLKQAIEMLSGGDRPVYDEGFVGPSGGAFAFNFGSATAGPSRENWDTIYQLDTDPAISAE